MRSTVTSPAKLVRSHALLSEQMTKSRLEIILAELAKVLDAYVAGDVVEFGCYSGTTSVFIQRLLDQYDFNKSFHVYDSFRGLPAKSIQDASVAGSEFKAGELRTSARELIRNFRHAGLKQPLVHKGWFEEIKPKELPQAIAFAFLDADFYRSIIDSLELVWPRLCDGGSIVIDDYMRPKLPGVTRAVSDFFKGAEDIHIKHQKNLAIIHRN